MELTRDAGEAPRPKERGGYDIEIEGLRHRNRAVSLVHPDRFGFGGEDWEGRGLPVARLLLDHCARV